MIGNAIALELVVLSFFFSQSQGPLNTNLNKKKELYFAARRLNLGQGDRMYIL